MIERKGIAIIIVSLLACLLAGCGDIDVKQNTIVLEVGSKSLNWEDYITIENLEEYNITYDSSQVDINTLGEYVVEYTFENKNNKKVYKKDYTFKVEDTTPPVIKLKDKAITIHQDEDFDPLKYITVTDNYDEITIDSIVVDSNVDTAILGNYKVIYTVVDNSGNKATDTMTVEIVEKIVELSAKQTILIEDTCEFYVDFTKISSEVYPPRKNGYYSYYRADSGKTYIDICIAYKNLSEKNVAADEVISASLLYANKYSFTGFSVIEEDSRSDFTYSNITRISPLTTEYIHYLFKVPEEINESTDSIVITLFIAEEEYNYIVR